MVDVYSGLEDKDILQTAAIQDISILALAGVAQWIEHWPANQGVTGSIPSQGRCLGCGPGPQQAVLERQPHIYVSLCLFHPPPLSKNK